jgi:ribonuclease HII
VASAVIFHPNQRLRGVKDSKVLSPAERSRLARRIRSRAAAVGVGACSPEEIDNLNVLWASMEAMRRAVMALEVQPTFVLIDGNQIIPDATWPAEAVVGGDAKSQSIAAASIIAKVERDRLMHGHHNEYPVYEWITNVGYPTRAHYRALELHGCSPLHRRSFNLQNPYDDPIDVRAAAEPAPSRSGPR